MISRFVVGVKGSSLRRFDLSNEGEPSAVAAVELGFG